MVAFPNSLRTLDDVLMINANRTMSLLAPACLCVSMAAVQHLPPAGCISHSRTLITTPRLAMARRRAAVCRGRGVEK